MMAGVRNHAPGHGDEHLDRVGHADAGGPWILRGSGHVVSDHGAGGVSLAALVVAQVPLPSRGNAD